MPSSARIPLRATTQDHLDVEDIDNDLVVLKDGSACLIMETSALNFGLLSEKEQEATIFAYGQLLNSLTFSIQIVIVSKQKDVSDYIKLLENQLSKTPSPKIQQQLLKYRDFVKAIVRQGNVLDKRFYISIPFSSLELGAGSAMKTLTNRQRSLPQPKEQILERAATNLSPKRDHVIRQLARIGLKARQLSTAELVQLFFDFYNRDHIGTKVQLPVFDSSSWTFQIYFLKTPLLLLKPKS